MGVQAQKAFNSGISPLDIGLIIVTTANPDFISVNVCLIQHNIGADNAIIDVTLLVQALFTQGYG